MPPLSIGIPRLGLLTNVSRFDGSPETARVLTNADVDTREGTIQTRAAWAGIVHNAGTPFHVFEAILPRPDGTSTTAVFLVAIHTDLHSIRVWKREDGEAGFSEMGTIADLAAGTIQSATASHIIVGGAVRLACQYRVAGVSFQTPVWWIGWIDRDFFGGTDNGFFHASELNLEEARVHDLGTDDVFTVGNYTGVVAPNLGTPRLVLPDGVAKGDWRYGVCTVYGHQYGVISQNRSLGYRQASEDPIVGKVTLVVPGEIGGWSSRLRSTALAVFRSPAIESGLSGFRLIGQVDLDTGFGRFENLTIVRGDTSRDATLVESQLVWVSQGLVALAVFKGVDRARLYGASGIPPYLASFHDVTLPGGSSSDVAARLETLSYTYRTGQAAESFWFSIGALGSKPNVAAAIGELEGDVLADMVEHVEQIPDQVVLEVTNNAGQVRVHFSGTMPTGVPFPKVIVDADTTDSGTDEWFSVESQQLVQDTDSWYAILAARQDNRPAWLHAGAAVRFYTPIDATQPLAGSSTRLSYFGCGSPIFAHLYGSNDLTGREIKLSIAGREYTITANPQRMVFTDGYSVWFQASGLGMPASPVGGYVTAPGLAWTKTAGDEATLTIPDSVADLNTRPRWVDLAGASTIAPYVRCSHLAHAGGRIFYGDVTIPSQDIGLPEERFPGQIAFSSINADGHVVPDVVDPRNVLSIQADGTDIMGLLGEASRVLAWTRRGIHRINLGSPDPAGWVAEHKVMGAGLMASASLAETPFGPIFLSPNGSRAFDGVDAPLVSDAIRPDIVLDIRAAGANALAAFDPRRRAYALHVFDSMWIGILPGAGDSGVRWTHYDVSLNNIRALSARANGDLIAATPTHYVELTGGTASDLNGGAFGTAVETQDLQLAGAGVPFHVTIVSFDVIGVSFIAGVYLSGQSTPTVTRVVTTGNPTKLTRYVLKVMKTTTSLAVKLWATPGNRLVVEGLYADVFAVPLGMPMVAGAVG